MSSTFIIVALLPAILLLILAVKLLDDRMKSNREKACIRKQNTQLMVELLKMQSQRYD